MLGAAQFSTRSSGTSQITWSTPRRIQNPGVCRSSWRSSGVHIILNRADHLLLEGILLPCSPCSESIDDQVRGDLLRSGGETQKDLVEGVIDGVCDQETYRECGV